jgi:AcrR family transcriptional regulator
MALSIPMSPRPYRLGQRQVATDQTRSRIVEAARELLASEGGLAGFSVDAVARQADVARMTVYYQFRSRLGLLEAVFDDLAGRGGMEGMPVVFTTVDPMEALDRFVGVFCRFWATDPVVMRSLRGAGAVDPELGAALRSREDRREQGLRVLIGRLGDRPVGAIDADAAVDVLHALTSFETYERLARGRTVEQVESILRRSARALLAVA